MCEFIEVNGIKYVPESDRAKDVEGLRPVLIRSYSSGVHFGLLAKEEYTLAGKVVVLISFRS